MMMTTMLLFHMDFVLVVVGCVGVAHRTDHMAMIDIVVGRCMVMIHHTAMMVVVDYRMVRIDERTMEIAVVDKHMMMVLVADYHSVIWIVVDQYKAMLVNFDIVVGGGDDGNRVLDDYDTMM